MSETQQFFILLLVCCIPFAFLIGLLAEKKK